MNLNGDLNCSWEACRDRDFALAKELGQREIDADSFDTQFAGFVGLAFAHSQDLEFDLAVAHFKDGLFIADHVDREAKMRLWLVHGLLERELGEYNIAIHLFERYFQRVSPNDDPAEMAFIYELLGMGFVRMGRYAEAHELWNEASRYEMKLGGGARISRLHSWHGLAHVQLGHWQEAADAYENALETITGPNIEAKTVYAEGGIAIAKARLGDPEKHVAAIRRAVRMADAKLQTRHECYYLRYLAEALMMMGEAEEAIETYLRCSEMSVRGVLFVRAKQSFQAILTYLDEVGDHERSLHHHRQYVELERRIHKIQLANRETSLQLLESVRQWRQKHDTDLVEL